MSHALAAMPKNGLLRKRLIAPTVCLLMLSCSIARSVRPLGQHRTALGLSLGGPLFTNLGLPIPAPNAVLFGRHGLRDHLDLVFGLYLPVLRAMGIDTGAMVQLWPQQNAIPNLMVGGRLQIFGNAKALLRQRNPDTSTLYPLDLAIFEVFEGNASWQIGDAHIVYTGLSLLTQIEKVLLLPQWGVGYQVWLQRHLLLVVELDWQAFATYQRPFTTKYVGWQHFGALAVQMGMQVVWP